MATFKEGDNTMNELTEARQIIRDLERVELRNAGDRRFLESWQGYLARTGKDARIGRYRLHNLRTVASSYGLCDPPQAAHAGGLD
jgi:hypothetical protein